MIRENHENGVTNPLNHLVILCRGRPPGGEKFEKQSILLFTFKNNPFWSIITMGLISCRKKRETRKTHNRKRTAVPLTLLF